MRVIAIPSQLNQRHSPDVKKIPGATERSRFVLWTRAEDTLLLAKKEKKASIDAVIQLIGATFGAFYFEAMRCV